MYFFFLDSFKRADKHIGTYLNKKSAREPTVLDMDWASQKEKEAAAKAAAKNWWCEALQKRSWHWQNY